MPLRGPLPAPHLQWVLGADRQDLVLEVAEFTAPGASLTDPADEAGLVGAAHGAVTAARAQELPLGAERAGPRSALLTGGPPRPPRRTPAEESSSTTTWNSSGSFFFHPERGESKKSELERNFSNQRAYLDVGWEGSPCARSLPLLDLAKVTETA